MGRRGILLTAVTLFAALVWSASEPPAAQAQLFSRWEAGLVRTLLNDQDPLARADAARQLGGSRDPNVIRPLAHAATQDPRPIVRKAATAAMARVRATTGGGFVPGGYPPGGSEVLPGGGNWNPIQPPGTQYPRPIGDPLSEMVQSYYQQYLNRSVDPAGLNHFRSMLERGVTPEEVQALLTSSEEYYRVKGGNPNAFIAGLFRDVLGREPSPRELTLWRDRFTQLYEGREPFTREFFAATRQERDQRRPGLLYR